MTVFICLDDKNGMLFNHRRQSRDKAVIEDMLSFAGYEKIYMNRYSSKLFEMVADRISVEDDFAESVPEEGLCFWEDIPLRPYEDRVECIVVYSWNRVYPADTFLDIDLQKDWEVADIKEFGGNSHEKITRRIYKRKDR
ncbi:MAG: ribonuclease Z [Lachnospiraceae bacterium]|jgi:hypothetical protein|nr:ribonuclease Z [Lachnospiraceae bacterium]